MGASLQGQDAGGERPQDDDVARRRAAVRAGSPDEGEQRLQLARALVGAGRPAEAAPELWWCFDHGQTRNRAFAPRRLGEVLDLLAEIARAHAPTHAELVRRRDVRATALLGGALDNSAVAEFLALNQVLRDPASSLATYDTLTGKRSRDELEFFYTGIRRELWAAKRYRELIDGRPRPEQRLETAKAALREATRRLVGRDLQPDPQYLARVVADVCLDVEARWALRDDAGGDRLADAVATFAPSLSTYAFLIAHARRAGAAAAEQRLLGAAETVLGSEACAGLAAAVIDAGAELTARAPRVGR